MRLKDVTPPFNKGVSNSRLAKGRGPLYLLLFMLLFIYYYVVLPPLHYASVQTWIFLLLIIGGILLIEILKDSGQFVQKMKQTPPSSFSLKGYRLPNKYRWVLRALIAVIAIGMIGNLIFSPFFMAKKYGQMIEPVTEDFQSTFPEVNMDQVPLVDRDTAVRLGNRQLGALPKLVSQFEVSEEYTQININAEPYRVTPLKYAGLFKWLNNFSEGIPNYLQVNNVTGQVEVKTPEKPIKYSYSDHLDRNILRHLRFNYPFSIFDRPDFEVDDQGIPYYIATTYKRNFFLNEPEPDGLIIVNAMSGEHKRYAIDQVPNWVDRVYPADLIMHQLDMNGKYRQGFWNALFAKEGVTETSDGYNYLPMKDDLYLYTGITSVVSDESNIGFVLVNLRTKEATMYSLSAAEEFSAMESAEGSVQEKGYKATFPLLINLQGKPMYILTLKDSSGLIKTYSLVDVQDYQKVYTANNMAQLIKVYGEDHPVVAEQLDEAKLEKIEGTIQSIQAVVRDGQTYYYLLINEEVYQVPVSFNSYLPFVEPGQTIVLKVDDQQTVHAIDLSEIFGNQAREESTATSEEKDPLLENLE